MQVFCPPAYIGNSIGVQIPVTYLCKFIKFSLCSVGNQKFEYASNLFIARVKLACLLFFHKDRKSALVEKTVNMTHTLFICRDARIKGAGGAAAPCPLAGGARGTKVPLRFITANT